MTQARRSLRGLQARPQGSLAPDTLRPDESLDAVWQDIRDGLEELATNGLADQVDLAEPGLTQRFFQRLQGRCRDRAYFFQQEFMEDDRDGHSPRVDLAALPMSGRQIVVNGKLYAEQRRFLALEAKRLPTKGTGREREYLTCSGSVQGARAAKAGRCRVAEKGGVARFKLGIHGADLCLVGMIGYVQRDSFEYWRDTINGWVDDLIAAPRQSLTWENSDKLQLEAASPRLAQLQSSHLRMGDSPRLTIRHFWVQLATESKPRGYAAKGRSPKTTA